MQLLGDEPLFVVLNAGSGRNDAVQTAAIIGEELARAGRRFTLMEVRDPRQIGRLAAEAVACAKRDNGIVVAAGGDGTLNAVANAVLDHSLPFAVLPQGTFNYFGRNHAIPAETAEATRMLLSGRIEAVQVGRVNGRVFLVNASLGLYPKLLEDRESYKRQYGRTRLVALFAGIATLLRQHRVRLIRLESEQGERTLRTPTLFVGNNALQLEQIGVPEAVALASGVLVGIALRPVGKLALLGLLLQGAMGKLGDAEHVEPFTFRRLVVNSAHVYSRRRIKVAMDGEISWMKMPLVFEVAAKPLQLIVPASSETAGVRT